MKKQALGKKKDTKEKRRGRYCGIVASCEKSPSTCLPLSAQSAFYVSSLWSQLWDARSSLLFSVCAHEYFLCQGPCSAEAKKLFSSVPLFSGVYCGPLRWILGSCPFPSPLILKFSLKEQIPARAKKWNAGKKEKKLHEIAHFRGRRSRCQHYMLWCCPTPDTLHSFETDILWVS